MSSTVPTLPSVLPSQPALTDRTTTAEQLASLPGRATNPTETPIFICAFAKCNRLYPSRERLKAHRKRDHESDDGESGVVSWNE